MKTDFVQQLCNQLGYPLVFFDVETTGVRVTQDRVLQISISKFFPNSTQIQHFSTLINPNEPFVPNEVSKITPQDVASAPSIEDLIDKLTLIFKDSILVGFNSENFDIPILREEFARVGKYFPSYIASYDAYAIFTKFNPRTLKAAVKTYLQREQQNAHEADSDVIDTIEVFNEQLNTHNLLSLMKTEQPVLDLLESCSFNQYCDAGKTIRKTLEGDFVLCEGAVKDLSVFNPLALPYLENARATSSSIDTRRVCEFFIDMNLSLQGQIGSVINKTQQ